MIGLNLGQKNNSQRTILITSSQPTILSFNKSSQKRLEVRAKYVKRLDLFQHKAKKSSISCMPVLKSLGYQASIGSHFN
jgi:hypothetical protein